MEGVNVGSASKSPFLFKVNYLCCVLGAGDVEMKETGKVRTSYCLQSTKERDREQSKQTHTLREWKVLPWRRQQHQGIASDRVTRYVLHPSPYAGV